MVISSRWTVHDAARCQMRCWPTTAFRRIKRRRNPCRYRVAPALASYLATHRWQTTYSKETRTRSRLPASLHLSRISRLRSFSREARSISDLTTSTDLNIAIGTQRHLKPSTGKGNKQEDCRLTSHDTLSPLFLSPSATGRLNLSTQTEKQHKKAEPQRRGRRTLQEPRDARDGK